MAGRSTLANLVVNLLFDASGAGAGIQSFGRQINELGRDITSVGKSMTQSLTVPILGAGSAMVLAASSFEDSLKQMDAMTEASAEQVKEWGAQILNLAPSVGKGPQELADALYPIASAGILGSDAMKLLEASAKASAAGMGEVIDISKAGISILNAYGTANIDGAKAMDILTKTAEQANAEVSQIAPVLGKVLPFAAELKVGFADVGAALAVMTRISGDAEISATQLRYVMQAFIDPTKEAEVVLVKAGTSLDEMRKMIAEKGLLSALEFLKGKLSSSGQELRHFFTDSTGLLGALQLVGDGASGVAHVFEEVGKNTGALNTAYATTDSLSRQLAQAWASIKVLGVEIGSVIIPMLTPALESVNGAIASAITWWRNLGIENQRIAVIFAAVIAIVGPLVVAIGLFIQTVGFAVGGVGLLVSGVGALAGGLLSIPALITMLIAELLAIADPSMIGKITSAFSTLVESVKSAFGFMILDAGTGVRMIGSALATFAASVVSAIGAAISAGIQAISSAMVSIGATMTSAISGMFSGAAGAVSGALDSITARVTGWAASILAKIKSVGQGIASMLGIGSSSVQPGPMMGGGQASGSAFKGSAPSMFQGAGAISSGFRSSAPSFSSSSMGTAGAMSPSALASGAPARPIEITVESILDGKSVAKSVVKNIPDVLGGTVGLRGSF